MKHLYLYIIDGWPSLVISYRPISSTHIIKRVYYKFSGSTVIRFFTATHKCHSDSHGGSEIITVELKSPSLLVLKGGTK